MEKFFKFNKTEKSNPALIERAERARECLARLGLTFDDLKGKRTLEIGAGTAEIAEAVQGKGATVFSLDLRPEMWLEEEEKIPDVPYVKANAMALPFSGETFDLIISHAGPFVLVSSKESVKKMILGAKRALKSGGELRFGPGNLNAAIFKEGELFSPMEEEKLTTEQRVGRIEKKSLEFLWSIDKNIQQRNLDDFSHFYFLKKQ